MFILFELDSQLSWGIDFVWPGMWGIRLGWIALHILFMPAHTWIDIIVEEKLKEKRA
jgi:hypothetical protein